MNKRFVVRQESFGATIYDRKSVKIDYIGADKFDHLLSGSVLDAKIGEITKSNSKIILQSRKDIDYLASPEKLFIELTKKCNLRCVHCFNESGQSIKGEWSWDSLNKVLEECEKLGVFKIRFTGGEPILSPYLMQALEFCKDHGITTSIGTNATLISYQIAKRLKKAGLDMAVVSIDGTGETYESIRRGAKYIDFINGVDNLVKSGIKVRLNMTLMKQNYDQIEKIIDFAKAKNVGLYIRRLIPIGRADLDNMVSQEDYLKAVELVENQKIAGFNFGIHYETSEVPEFGIDMLDTSKKCSCAVRGLAISPNGDVFGCGLFVALGKKYCFGNLNQQTLDELWHESPKLQSIRHKVSHSFCLKECVDKGSCLGSCLVMSEISGGVDYYCSKYEV